MEFTGTALAGRALRASRHAAQSRIHGGCRAIAGPGHRRQYGDLRPGRYSHVAHAARAAPGATRRTPATVPEPAPPKWLVPGELRTLSRPQPRLFGPDRNVQGQPPQRAHRGFRAEIGRAHV